MKEVEIPKGYLDETIFPEETRAILKDTGLARLDIGLSNLGSSLYERFDNNRYVLVGGFQLKSLDDKEKSERNKRLYIYDSEHITEWSIDTDSELDQFYLNKFALGFGWPLLSTTAGLVLLVPVERERELQSA